MVLGVGMQFSLGMRPQEATIVLAGGLLHMHILTSPNGFHVCLFFFFKEENTLDWEGIMVVETWRYWKL